MEDQGYVLKTCHEASYLGFSLHRSLQARGIESTVIAPSLIPKAPGKRVKTDRLDCLELAKNYALGTLTPVYVPDDQDEAIRGLIRTRQSFVKEKQNHQRKALSIIRRCGWNYRQEMINEYRRSGAKIKNPTHWTQKHRTWLNKKLSTCNDVTAFQIKAHLKQCDSLSMEIAECEAKLASCLDNNRYKKPHDALCCLRGVSTLTAMTLITEIGDIRRFAHPTSLTSYAGLDVTEYSSGGKEKKFGITKMGNRHLRTASVESCQHLGRGYGVSKYLKARRQGQPEEVINIANKCGRRLRKRHLHLQGSGKHANKVKVACAREFLSFAWAIMTAVA